MKLQIEPECAALVAEELRRHGVTAGALQVSIAIAVEPLEGDTPAQAESPEWWRRAVLIAFLVGQGRSLADIQRRLGLTHHQIRAVAMRFGFKLTRYRRPAPGPAWRDQLEGLTEAEQIGLCRDWLAAIYEPMRVSNVAGITAMQARALAVLDSARGEWVTKEGLRDAMWGPMDWSEYWKVSLSQKIGGLRKKLPDGLAIEADQTGRGYRLIGSTEIKWTGPGG
jgi:hypothetical protein